MNNYSVYLEHECGWNTRVTFGDVFHVHATVCPECGAYIPNTNIQVENDRAWELFAGKLVRYRTRPLKWWNPTTWFATDTKLERRK